MADETIFPESDLLNLMTPADGAAAVTPHNTTALTITCRALYIGGAGDVAVTMKNGDTVTFTGVLAGTVLPVRCTHVKVTGTTATNIVALY